MKKIMLLFTLACFIQVETIYSQNNFLHRQGKTIIDGSGNQVNLRGVNLGGWLFWEDWIWGAPGGSNISWMFTAETNMLNRMTELVGNTATQQFRQQEYANYITKDDIAAISKSCFNVVRIHFNHRLLEDDSLPYVYKQSGWNILDSVVNWCEQYKVYIVLDMTKAPGAQCSICFPAVTMDPDTGSQNIWNNATYQSRAIALWKAIATRYSTRPYIAGWDLLNEPAPPLLFGGLYLTYVYSQIIQAIRTVDTHHMVFLEGASGATDFSMFTGTLLDSNMSYTFHTYKWLGNPPNAVHIADSMVNNFDVPMWCGEWGVDNYANLDTIRKLLDDPIHPLSGWADYTWKGAGPQGDFIRQIQPTALWTKVISWLTDTTLTKPTYNETIQGMNEFIQSMQYKNTVKDTIMATILNVCNVTTDVFSIDQSNVAGCKVYPNPANNILNVTINDNPDKMHYSVYNLIGSKFSEGTFAGHESHIDVSNYPDGMYFLKLSDGTSEITKKFLVGKN